MVLCIISPNFRPIAEILKVKSGNIVVSDGQTDGRMDGRTGRHMKLQVDAWNDNNTHWRLKVKMVDKFAWNFRMLET